MGVSKNKPINSLSADWYTNNKFLKKEHQVMKWFNLALGYSVDGLTGANENPSLSSNGHDCNYQRKSKLLLSLDVNLKNIKTKNRFLKSLLSPFSVIKIPFPTIEFINNETNYKCRNSSNNNLNSP